MRVRLGVLALVAALAVSAVSAPAANQTVTLDMTNTFTPAAVTVNQGETVTWKNNGGLHNVHFDDNSYVQPASPQSAPWTVSRTFNTPGTFRYYCQVHGGPGGLGMSGTVTVNPVGYPRPKGATPALTSLAVAYKPCASANRTHGAPLSSPSCNPPVQESSFLTVGTMDANGQPANAAGSVRLDAKATSPEDVKIVTSVTDVRNQSGLSDYSGELQANPTIRITDRFNSANPPTQPFADSATTVDIPFPVTVACAPTMSDTIGSTCSVATTANSVLAGAVNDAVRTIWQLGQIRVFDGGSDGVASTSGNTLFMNEGIFAP
jgi:plastocyanin